MLYFLLLKTKIVKWKRLMLRYMYTACLFRNCKFCLKQELVTSVCLRRQQFDGKPMSCTKRQRQICTKPEALYSHLRHSPMHVGVPALRQYQTRWMFLLQLSTVVRHFCFTSLHSYWERHQLKITLHENKWHQWSYNKPQFQPKVRLIKLVSFIALPYV